MQARTPLRFLLLGCWLGLMLLIGAPLLLQDNASLGFWLMQAIPLMLTLPGLIKLSLRTLLWLGFLVQFYFINGVLQMAGTDAAQRWLGALTLLLCLTLFTTVIVAVRRLRKSKAPATQPQQTSQSPE